MADFQSDPRAATVVRPLVFDGSFVRKYVGAIYEVTCPFCQAPTTVRKSSLNGKGKRCECGALLKGRGASALEVTT